MGKTVILANGVFPRKGGEAWRLLEGAQRVVACDGAANAYARRFRRVPDFIVGDLDSLKPNSSLLTPHSSLLTPHASRLVPVPDQSTNDLSKAIAFCRARGWKDLVIVGAMGRREDHALGNVFRAMEAGVEIVTDFGRFVPATERLRLRVGKGTPVSVFATEKDTRMRSRGLVWPLDEVRFENLYCATLNRASSSVIEICSSRSFFIYIAFHHQILV